MTVAEMIVCVAVFAELSSSGNKAFTRETHEAIAQNICAAANKTSADPRVLAAYALTENRKFELFAASPAANGRDMSLFQINSHYHANRPNADLVVHPFYGTEIAASIIAENFKNFGVSWQAIAAYWNPKQAKAQTKDALAYYERWLSNYRQAERVFQKFERNLSQGITQ